VVSAGISVAGKLHFVDERAKVNADYSESCRRRYYTDMVFIFQHDGVQANTAHSTHDWLHATAMTLLRNMNGHQTRRILMRLFVGCRAERLPQARQ